jgi:plastocyanin
LLSKHEEVPMITDRLLYGRRELAAAAMLLALTGGAAARAEAAATYTVTISQMRYGSVPDHLKAGDTIVWVNKDTVQHTVTAKDHSFDVRIAPGKQASQVLTKAGTFAFYCVYHPTMRGVLKVGG